MSTRERDFRPPRHRSFDDDRYETPTDDFGFEPRPSASTSSGPAVRAVVKWYKPEKGFGFVALSDGSGDAFLHASVLERYGARSVPPGAALEVRAGPGPKGPQVTEVLNVDASTALQEHPGFARPERPVFSRTARAPVEELGTVKWYSAIKGFGFIAPDQGQTSKALNPMQCCKLSLEEYDYR